MNSINRHCPFCNKLAQEGHVCQGDPTHARSRPEPGGEKEAHLLERAEHYRKVAIEFEDKLTELKERLKLTDEEKEPVEYLSKCKRDEFTYYEDKLLDIILRITSSRGNG